MQHRQHGSGRDAHHLSHLAGAVRLVGETSRDRRIGQRLTVLNCLGGASQPRPYPPARQRHPVDSAPKRAGAAVRARPSRPRWATKHGDPLGHSAPARAADRGRPIDGYPPGGPRPRSDRVIPGRRDVRAMPLHRCHDQCRRAVLEVRRVHDGDLIANSDHDLKGRMTVHGAHRRRAAIHRVALTDGEARVTRHGPSRRACPPGRCPLGDRRRRNRQPRDSVLERGCIRGC